MKQTIFTVAFLLTSSLPIFSQTNDDTCPKYELVAPFHVLDIGRFGVFEVKGDENFKKLNLTYDWTVTNGDIHTGQGSSFLIVKSDSKEDVNIKVSVSIQGLPKQCVSNFSDEAIFLGIPKPSLVDESGRAALPGNVKANLDNYFTNLQNNPSAEGFIVFKAKTKSAVNEQLKKVSSHIYFRGQDAARFVYRIIISKTEENTAYWVVPSGAEFPSEEKAFDIRASEYQNVKDFFAADPRRKR